MGGKSSAFKPIKKASSPATNSAVASLSISLSQPSKAPSSPNKAAKSDKSGQSQESAKPESENSGALTSALSAVKSPDEKRAVRIAVTEAEADIKQNKVGDAESRVNDVNVKDAGEKKESDHSDKDNSSGKTAPTTTDLDSSTQSNVTNGHSECGEQNPEDERVGKTNVTDVNNEKKVVKSAAVDDSTKSDYVTEIKTTFVNGIIEETFIN